MYFGTQYYRPPFPSRENWRRDIEHMKSLGFNIVKLWAVWNWIERKPGIFDFSELDELVEIADENGLDVMLNTIPEGAPYWTADITDSFYQTAEGEKLGYSGPANIPSAGWPGLCPDSPEAERIICNFIEKTAEHFSDAKAVTVIDVWNEPHLEPMFDYSGRLLCYCVHSRVKFIEWLKQKYGAIEHLNRVWFRAYSSWEQVVPPARFGTTADMLDWRRFWLYNLQNWLRTRVKAAKRGAPDKIVQTHPAFSGYMGANNLGGLGNELGDEFLLAREVDAFGLSSFPLWLMGERHVEGHFINAELIAEAAGDKPFYQVELQGGAGKAGLLGGKVPSAQDIRQWNLNVIAAGGKGVLYWQYSPEPAGMESPGFGLVNADGSDTPRSISASECANRFTTPMLANARRCLSSNAIYISRNSDLLTYAMGNEELYNRSFAGIYRILYEQGIPVRFVHSDYVEQLNEQGVRNIYAPMPLCLDDVERDALLSFARQGGRLIVEGCAGLYRENGEIDMQSRLLNELFGMTGVNIEPVEKKCTAESDGRTFSVMAYRQLYAECDNRCEVLARFQDGREAALRIRIGSGEAIWISGFAGAAYHLSPDEDTSNYIAALFDPNGYDAVESLDAKGLTVRLIQNETVYCAVCVNRTDAPLPARVKLRGLPEITAQVPAQDGIILECPK